MHNRLKDASYFTYSISIDTVHIDWNGKKDNILVLQDDFSELEMDGWVKSETFKEERKTLDKWIEVYGKPMYIRTDASGAHMSDAFLEHTHSIGITVKLIPTDAHHHLGSIERSHAVRRKHIELYQLEHASDDLCDCLRRCTAARNSMRNVRGMSPFQLALGVTPQRNIDVDEVPYRIVSPNEQ
jgi:hypothetical protein